MRYAFSTSPQRTTWAWLREVWKRADDQAIFEAGWTFDHFYPIYGDATEDCLEGWITLTALLHETQRLRGGVLVTGMVYRHPAVLANMAATLDITSGGRLELGIGAGWNQEECDAYGIELGTLRERFDRFEEGLAVIEGLLSQELTTFSGQYYHLTAARCDPKPVQRPLPVCIGGVGLRRTLPLAARYAHHWNYGSAEMSLDDFHSRRAALHAACEQIGRDPAEITISALIRYTGEVATIAEEARALEAAGVDIGIVSIPKQAPPTEVDEIAAALRN